MAEREKKDQKRGWSISDEEERIDDKDEPKRLGKYALPFLEKRIKCSDGIITETTRHTSRVDEYERAKRDWLDKDSIRRWCRRLRKNENGTGKDRKSRHEERERTEEWRGERRKWLVTGTQKMRAERRREMRARRKQEMGAERERETRSEREREMRVAEKQKLKADGNQEMNAEDEGRRKLNLLRRHSATTMTTMKEEKEVSSRRWRKEDAKVTALTKIDSMWDWDIGMRSEKRKGINPGAREDERMLRRRQRRRGDGMNDENENYNATNKQKR